MTEDIQEIGANIIAVLFAVLIGGAIGKFIYIARGGQKTESQNREQTEQIKSSMPAPGGSQPASFESRVPFLVSAFLYFLSFGAMLADLSSLSDWLLGLGALFFILGSVRERRFRPPQP
jgi:hypothetical protein